VNASGGLSASTNTTVWLSAAEFTVSNLKVKHALHIPNYKRLILMKGIEFRMDFDFKNVFEFNQLGFILKNA
jgi:hypothetical protein